MCCINILETSLSYIYSIYKKLLKKKFRAISNSLVRLINVAEIYNSVIHCIL